MFVMNARAMGCETAVHRVMRPTARKEAYDRIRTGDLFLTKEVLYLLSYIGTRKRETGLEPATLSLEG